MRMDEDGRASLTDFVCWASALKCVEELIDSIQQVQWEGEEDGGRNVLGDGEGNHPPSPFLSCGRWKHPIAGATEAFISSPAGIKVVQAFLR